MKFIVLSGVDGSGKSTQLKLLGKELAASGKKVAYFHAVEFSLANRLVRFFKGQKAFEPGREKAVMNVSWVGLHVRAKFLFLDMVRFRCLLSRLRREKYDYLLSDRSFYDSFINLRYLAQQIAHFAWAIKLDLRLLKAILPAADKGFYFDIDPRIILARDRTPEQGIEYLWAKQTLFKQEIAGWALLTIDANRDKEIILQDILANI